jgi:hypothetical protein
VARLQFDDEDHFLGIEVNEDPAVVIQHCYWRDAMWHHAMTRDEFADWVERQP